MEILLSVLIALGVVTIILLVVLLVRNPQSKLIRLEGDIRNIQGSQDRAERVVKEEIAKNREEMAGIARQDREEVSRQFQTLGHSVLSGISEMSSLQKNQLDTFSNQLSSLTGMNEQKLENMRNTVEERLKSLQDENARKLEQIRETVDEKLHATLEKKAWGILQACKRAT